MDSRNNQALTKADVKHLTKLKVPRDVIRILLVAQLRHLIFWERNMLLRHFEFVDDVDPAEIRKRRDVLEARRALSLSGSSEPDMMAEQRAMERDHPDYWLYPGTSLWKSTVAFPDWMWSKYREAQAVCATQYKLTKPVVRGDAPAFNDIYMKDEQLPCERPSREHADCYVVVCLQEGEYAGHIYAWMDPDERGRMLAQGIRSSIWKNTLGVCDSSSKKKPRVATLLLEGVRQLAKVFHARRMAIDNPLPSMRPVLRGAGFSAVDSLYPYLDVDTASSLDERVGLFSLFVP
jgi:hypothetical protein